MRASAIIDTNLLLLAIVGELRPDRIGYGRLSAFRPQDISILKGEIEKFDQFVTVPNVLAETSNFIRSSDREICEGANRLFVEYVLRAKEIYIPSNEVVRIQEFLRLGLTDTAILKVAKRKITTITDDFPLANRLHKLGLPCINFNHLRTPD